MNIKRTREQNETTNSFIHRKATWSICCWYFTRNISIVYKGLKRDFLSTSQSNFFTRSRPRKRGFYLSDTYLERLFSEIHHYVHSTTNYSWYRWLSTEMCNTNLVRLISATDLRNVPRIRNVFRNQSESSRLPCCASHLVHQFGWHCYDAMTDRPDLRLLQQNAIGYSQVVCSSNGMKHKGL